MALTNRVLEPDRPAGRTVDEVFRQSLADNLQIVQGSKDGCGEVTIYFKDHRPVRVAATISELIKL